MSDFDLVEETEFFAPVASDMIDGLVGQYEAMRKRIEAMGAHFAGENGAAVHYFLEAARLQDRHFTPPADLFDVPAAVASLNAAYWSKALQLTDVLDMMPQKRRDEWNQQISHPMGTKGDKYAKTYITPPLPDFTDENVRTTLQDLLSMRSQFLSERVDGIFRGLSGEHVTNAPEAFGKRMIIAYVINDYYSTNHGRAGLINDLRAVIAKFMGRDEPRWSATSSLIETLKHRWGEWVTVDGGALRIRLYKKGTAHLEVHPDMAWRLNQILAFMYPLAIPAQFRQRPAKRSKLVAVMQRPLPFSVIDVLSQFKRDKYKSSKQSGAVWSFGYAYGSENKHARAEAERIIESIGGAQTAAGAWEFDYDPTDAVEEIVASGCVPDHKSHQFYPTPEKLARIAIEAASIGDTDRVLEPSAGQGGIAQFLPADRTTCIELSSLHCKVLAAKGFNTICADFLNAAGAVPGYDRIVMNPPFDQGRWQAHVEHAAKLLKPAGRLVAILPASAKTRELLPGLDVSWQGPFDNEFAGTSVSVVILTATKPGQQKQFADTESLFADQQGF